MLRIDGVREGDADEPTGGIWPAAEKDEGFNPLFRSSQVLQMTLTIHFCAPTSPLGAREQSMCQHKKLTQRLGIQNLRP
uniref:Uncharacterized protein n=1 Tax=Setaria digitata TaxID=48799 RepID=A0A915PNI1_9BILA